MPHTPIDIPFNFRHQCWFCGEPSLSLLMFPRNATAQDRIEHAPLALPACSECQSIKSSHHLQSVWQLRAHIRQALISKYAKHLGIGENWTKQELVDSEFSGAILGGFGKSAWKMYEIAKQRVSFQSWPLSINEIPLSSSDDTSRFEYNGTTYSSVKACIDYFVQATNIDEELLTQLISLVTPKRFDYALKIAKLNKRISNAQRSEIIEEIRQQETESREIELNKQNNIGAAIHSTVTEVTLSGVTAPVFAIQWALKQGISNLAELCHIEDAYFDDHQHLGGAKAFASYNGLQLYLQAREDVTWTENHDPNKLLWEH
ncbi:hypothetical protein KP803_06780 [Vibrio sp. ZSDE26]|uniref:Uncharacterized protein n=1 Tax=Vibrio amylolyticus TaxID=2847292 RepID=A0A9X1XJH6_9VIBR|nr:hypothetical protein [Vibrio amylolyticus]MCK6262983.1 hypothetical protein [Vibrio amylolyticus]